MLIQLLGGLLSGSRGAFSLLGGEVYLVFGSLQFVLVAFAKGEGVGRLVYVICWYDMLEKEEGPVRKKSAGL